MPPNIIYFHTHDMGRWIEPYGFPVPTPNFNRFADEALLFRRAFCAAPTCSPSRAALTTGMAAHSAGMLGLAHRGFGPVPRDRHISTTFRENGYETVLAGVQHETTDPGRDLSYDHQFRGVGEDAVARDRSVGAQATEWIRNRRADRPFFMALGLFMPHRVFPDPRPEDRSDRLTPPFPVSDAPDGRRDFAAYRAATGVADAVFGQLWATLKESGLDASTVLLVTTDHGPAFPGLKCNLYDGGIGITFMLRWPGMPCAGEVSEALVSHIDVFPTLCDLGGLPTPDWVQGNSLLPVLRGEKETVNDAIFAEVSYHAAYEPMRCVRTERHKLIRRFDPDRLRPVLPNVDAGPEKSRLLEAGWQELEQPAVELYDLATDPFETRNRADDPRMSDVRRELETRLENWMRETGDPLLEYAPRIPAPPGATVNVLESIDPQEKVYE